MYQRLHDKKAYLVVAWFETYKKIAERHRGRIRVESESGNGSTFYFTIPDGLEEHIVLEDAAIDSIPK